MQYKKVTQNSPASTISKMKVTLLQQATSQQPVEYETDHQH